VTGGRFRKPIATLALVFSSLVFSLIAGESAVRLLGSWNEEGAFYFRGRPVRPFVLPVNRAKRLLAEYRAATDSHLMADPDLGWSYRPSSASRDGLSRCNSQGLRADRDYSDIPPEGVLRVALFGDSFIQGAGVGQTECLAPQMETALARRGVRAEVLNFGVSGYGFGQTLLRYRRDGRRFHPDLVIAGLQLGNIKRDVNLFYLVIFPESGIFFTKPVFTLKAGRLDLANSPTLPIESIPATLAEFDRSPLRPLETLVRDADFTPHAWQRSKLLAVALDQLRRLRGRSPDEVQRPDGPAFQLTQALIEEFRADAEQSGSRFELIYLPLRETLRACMRPGRDPFQPHLDRIASRLSVVDPRPALIAAARDSSFDALFASDQGHYSARGNGIVAAVLADEIARGEETARRSSGTRPSPSFTAPPPPQ
jgi:hypothetical protein